MFYVPNRLHISSSPLGIIRSRTNGWCVNLEDFTPYLICHNRLTHFKRRHWIRKESKSKYHKVFIPANACSPSNCKAVHDMRILTPYIMDIFDWEMNGNRIKNKWISHLCMYDVIKSNQFIATLHNMVKNIHTHTTQQWEGEKPRTITNPTPPPPSATHPHTLHTASYAEKWSYLSLISLSQSCSNFSRSEGNNTVSLTVSLKDVLWR